MMRLLHLLQTIKLFVRMELQPETLQQQLQLVGTLRYDAKRLVTLLLLLLKWVGTATARSNPNGTCSS
jgi:hypothetical protein